MFNFIAVTLATVLIPTAPANTMLTENYSSMAAPTVYVRPSKIQTPNGSDVDIYYQDEGDLSEMDNHDALLSDYFTYADNNSYIFLKTRGSYTYNNFAYAFYMYWGGNIKCLITDINPFIEDKSFIEVSSPQPEDIIVYRTNNKPIHAGIIKSVLYEPANKDIGSNVIVESKWYPNGVFEHRGDLCPYMPKYHLLAGEPADNVVYYRRHEAHNFKVVAGSNNSTTHTSQCE